MKLEINITRQSVVSLAFAAVAVLLINYAVAQSQPNPGHSASGIGPGTFAAGDYVFPSGSNVQVGGNLDVQGNTKVTGNLNVTGSISATGGTAVYKVDTTYCESPGSLSTSTTCKTMSCGTGYDINYQLVTCYYGCDSSCSYLEQSYITRCYYVGQQTCSNQLVGRLVANA